jgi:predicted GNAT family acetyltransferase
MTSIIRTESFNEFYDSNYKRLLENPMLNYHIIDVMKKIASEEIVPDLGFNVVSENRNIVVLKTDLVCLIYGNDFDEEMLRLLSDELQFEKFRGYYFAGSKNILEALFALNNSSYRLEKYRIIYKCEKVTEDFEYAPGELHMGDISRLKELANLSRAFIKEWDGQEKSLEEQKRNVAAGIANDNFYQWLYRTNIAAIAQVMCEPYDFPVIGHLYANAAFRNQGFASSIVHSITKGLLDEGDNFVMLSADGNNPASNTVFKRTGYESVGDYIRIWKNKS